MDNQEIAKVLDLLAERFGTTVDYLWGIMVKQAGVYAISALFMYVALFVLTYFYIGYVNRNGGLGSLTDNSNGIVHMFACCFLAMAYITAIIFLPSVVTLIFNPEFWALQQVFSVLN